MTGFEGVALIIGIFFVIGIGVGFLAVMAIPALVRVLAAIHRNRLDRDGWDPPDIGPPWKGPPSARGPNGAEPDDRDDPRWWGRAD